MIALTTQDIAAGWFIIGVVTCLAGVGVIALVRSSWSEKQARRAVRTMTDWPETARIVEEYQHWSDVIERDIAQAMSLADHTAAADRRLSSVARVVPMQRRGGE